MIVDRPSFNCMIYSLGTDEVMKNTSGFLREGVVWLQGDSGRPRMSESALCLIKCVYNEMTIRHYNCDACSNQHRGYLE